MAMAVTVVRYSESSSGLLTVAHPIVPFSFSFLLHVSISR